MVSLASCVGRRHNYILRVLIILNVLWDICLHRVHQFKLGCLGSDRDPQFSILILILRRVLVVDSDPSGRCHIQHNFLLLVTEVCRDLYLASLIHLISIIGGFLSSFEPVFIFLEDRVAIRIWLVLLLDLVDH